MHAFFVLVALSFSLVNAAVVPRAQPATYDSNLLEPYDVYHARYIALSCQTQHDTQFFADCCHPLLKDQPLSSRPANCNPATNAPANNPPPDSPSPPDTSAVTGGVATFFFQNGVAGACGTVHQDSDLICAMDIARYGDDSVPSPLCGRSVRVTNAGNGKSVDVVIADVCPTCMNRNSIDLSERAFENIADLSEGVVDIIWEYI